MHNSLKPWASDRISFDIIHLCQQLCFFFFWDFLLGWDSPQGFIAIYHASKKEDQWLPLLACYTRYAALQAREHFIYEYYASHYARGVIVDKDFSVSCLHYFIQKSTYCCRCQARPRSLSPPGCGNIDQSTHHDIGIWKDCPVLIESRG